MPTRLIRTRTPAKKYATPIRWTPQEFDLIADSWIDFCKQTNQDPLKPKTPMSRIIDHAQRALPEERHRPKPSLQGVKNLVTVFDAIKRRQKASKQAEEAQARLDKEIADKPQNPVQLVPEPAPKPGVGPPPLVLQPIKADATGEVPIANLEALIQDFAHNVAAMVVGETMRMMRDEFKKEFPKLHQKAQTVAKIIPKILVVGPLRRQQEELEQAVKGLVDLKFVESEESARLVALRGPSCSAAILWSNYMSHSHQDATYRILPRESVRVVSGSSLSAVKDALEEIALQITDAQPVS